MWDYSKLITSRWELEAHYRYNQGKADIFESKAILAKINNNDLDFKMYSNLAEGFKLRVKELRKVRL